ncbi:MAG: hypothetical protein QOG59_984 [Solirubrobacteraceae bacterium]|jgi:hypothetical protein|nr:hypothetical protein [Solirubrobacteraceae bacterium]
MTAEDLDPVTRLELDQYLSATSQPVPRATLSPRAQAGLWALRVVAVVLGVMVIVTFISQLGQ